MPECFRSVLERLDKENGLLHIRKPVDVRYMSPLIVQADKPVWFHDPISFDIPVVSGLYWKRDRLARSLNWPESELGVRFPRGVQKMMDPVTVEEAPCQEAVKLDDEVDLTELPIPFLGERDGGAFISAGVLFARDDEGVVNAGVYRLMYRSRNETSVDLVTNSDLRRCYEAAFKRQEPLPIAVCIGVHPFEMLCAAFKAPPGVSEMNIAGGLHGEPVRTVPAKTNDLPVLADCEIVLEGEIAPVGWTVDEGPFGDFAGMYTEVRWNPTFSVKSMTHRKNPLFQVIQMPWENAWLGAVAMEAQVLEVLSAAGVSTVAVRVTEGSACRWSVIVSIRKRAGGGKNALMAILALPDTKHAVVVDEDVDIFDPEQLEWAKTFRVQADQDVMIISGAQGKHIDPSVRAWELPKGQLPTTSKMGIDATTPEGIPPDHYEIITHPFRDEVKLESFL